MDARFDLGIDVCFKTTFTNLGAIIGERSDEGDKNVLQVLSRHYKYVEIDILSIEKASCDNALNQQ